MPGTACYKSTYWVKIGEVQNSSHGRMTDFSGEMGDNRKHQVSRKTDSTGAKISNCDLTNEESKKADSVQNNTIGNIKSAQKLR